MDKKNKRLSILMGITFGLFLIAFLLLYAADVKPEQDFLKTPAYCLFAAGLIPFGIALFLSFKDIIERSKKEKEYLSYPLNEIVNFKAELNTVRANFEADTDKEKNRVLKTSYNNVHASMKPFYDENLVKVGKIYYGALVQANSNLFRKTKMFPVLPGVILYSTDEHYESHPQELKEIARELFSQKDSNILQYERQYFSNILLPAEQTNGRKVYMTTLMISREHLPQFSLCGGMFPVIAAPEQSTSVFVADCKYWTKDLIANFIHNQI